MDLPTVLMSGDEDMLADEEGFDVDLLDRFPKRLREVEPVTKAATAGGHGWFAYAHVH